MPEALQILKVQAAAALAAGVVVLAVGWRWRASGRGLAPIGGVAGASLGFFLGCSMLGVRTHWPPSEDLDRLLLVLFPVLIVTELVAPFVSRSPWLIWFMRILVAFAAAPVLLHGSIYLADLAGPGTREWTPTRACLILGGLGAALTTIWALLGLLVRRSQGRAVALAAAIACGGAGLTVMLSGYASGGQIGLPLATALAATVAASLFFSGTAQIEGVLSLGVVGLFALLVIGRFFGQLATGHAAMLLMSLLLSWVPEIPVVARLLGRLRGAAGVVLVAMAIGATVAFAQLQFAADSAQSSPGPNEPSSEDYSSFGR